MYSLRLPASPHHERTSNYCSSFCPQDGFPKRNSWHGSGEFVSRKTTLWPNNHNVMFSRDFNSTWFGNSATRHGQNFG
jgi:hypothetical protein